jgi:hypothetical protein
MNDNNKSVMNWTRKFRLHLKTQLQENRLIALSAKLDHFYFTNFTQIVKELLLTGGIWDIKWRTKRARVRSPAQKNLFLINIRAN